MRACLIIDNALIKSGLIKLAAVDAAAAKTLTEVLVSTPSGVLRPCLCLSVVFEVKAVILIYYTIEPALAIHFRIPAIFAFF